MKNNTTLQEILKYVKPDSISMTEEVIDIIIEEANKNQAVFEYGQFCHGFLDYLVIAEINRNTDNLEYKILYKGTLIARKVTN